MQGGDTAEQLERESKLEKVTAQWLAMDMGMSVEEVEEVVRKKRKVDTHIAVNEPEEEALPIHLDLPIEAAVMDKVTIVGCHGCKEAIAAAKAVRQVRGMYVDDLRLWLQLMEPKSYKAWLERKGVSMSVSTPYVALNNTQLPGGVKQLLQSLPYWRGDKIARDVACPSLVLVHMPYDGTSSSSAVVGDRRTGNAYIVNPRRDTLLYNRILEAEGLALKGVLMTHTIWDSASGHACLQRAFSVPIYMGKQPDHLADADRCFEFTVLKEEKVLMLGSDTCIRCVPTPGHTLDSMTYAVTCDDKEVAAFTGSNLLIDTVGRVDVESHVAVDGPSAEVMAAFLYESLVKVCSFDDECVVFPSHCGMQFSGHTVEPKWSCKLRIMYDGGNHALSFIPGHKKSAKDAGKAAFLGHMNKLWNVTIPFNRSFRDLYFLNAYGQPRQHVPREPGTRLPPIVPLEDFIKTWDAAAGARSLKAHLEPSEGSSVDLLPLLLDVRKQGEYCNGYVKGSISIPMLPGIRFEAFAAACIARHSFLKIVVVMSNLDDVHLLMYRLGLVALDAYVERIVLVSGREQCTLPTLVRVGGYDEAVGLGGEDLVDVRSGVENSSQAVASAVHVPLESVKQWAASQPLLSAAKPFVAYCAGGYRSFIAATIMNAFAVPATDVCGGGLTIMSLRPDLWSLKDPSIKCTS
eukprot:TRINITY_DN17403_c1_g1_i2.p1 TRINITY_DN17403_c1_g1~~TRINITY_DN17403_c1_g1_i2.p1  ORF type:complete len:687 (+),score=200.02 TRINITY_DN17403_c1_g1_i2:260-2320(+)